MTSRPTTFDQVEGVPDELTIRRLLALLMSNEAQSEREAS